MSFQPWRRYPERHAWPRLRCITYPHLGFNGVDGLDSRVAHILQSGAVQQNGVPSTMLSWAKKGRILASEEDHALRFEIQVNACSDHAISRESPPERAFPRETLNVGLCSLENTDDCNAVLPSSPEQSFLRTRWRSKRFCWRGRTHRHSRQAIRHGTLIKCQRRMARGTKIETSPIPSELPRRMKA